MTQLIAPLVGAYYHPPAQAIIQILPAGTELILEPDPTNQFDSNAIKVLIDWQKANLDKNQIEEIAAGHGYSVLWTEYSTPLGTVGFTGPSEDSNLANPLHLGYIPQAVNTHWLETMANEPDYKASLSFNAQGKPTVILESAQ